MPPAQIAFYSRLFSVFAGVLGVALVAALGYKAGGRLSGLLAAVVAAGSPFWLAESQETRMYTVGFALLAAAAVAFWGARAREIGDRRAEIGDWRAVGRRVVNGPSIGFILLSTAALLTHYNAVFILVAWYGWWGIWALIGPKRWQSLGVVVLSGLAMTLLASPILPIALRQLPEYENPNITIPSIGDYLQQNWQAYLGGYAFDPALLAGQGTLWLWTVLALAVVGAGIGLTAAWRRRASAASGAHLEFGVLTFLLAWLVGGLALYYIAVLDRNSFNVRYASFITPALFVLMGAGFAAFAVWWKPLPVAALAILLVGVAPALQADLYDPRFDREHIGEVTNWLRANTRPGDVIFVDQKYPFGFYYQPFTTDPAAVLNGDEPPARYLFVDINTLDQQLVTWAKDAQRVFWVQWFESDTDPRRAVHFLLDKYGQQGGEQWFQGYSIDWWDMNPPTDFVLAPSLQPLQVRFGSTVQTVALSLPEQSLAPGELLPVAIQWQRAPGDPVAQPLKARVALYDGADNRLVQADERLLNDRHRAPVEWRSEDQPLNVYSLPLPEDLPEGEYAVRLLVYTYIPDGTGGETTQPLDFMDVAGNPAGQETAIGKVIVENR
ncbi:MAG: hypothetical protein IPK16_07060 [Anaerolineales bacterium]|nr:hypothetical protein [Anaerolineales bacterium]